MWSSAEERKGTSCSDTSTSDGRTWRPAHARFGCAVLREAQYIHLIRGSDTAGLRPQAGAGHATAAAAGRHNPYALTSMSPPRMSTLCPGLHQCHVMSTSVALRDCVERIAGHNCEHGSASLGPTACRRQTWLPWPPHLGLYDRTTQTLLAQNGRCITAERTPSSRRSVAMPVAQLSMAVAALGAPLMMCQVSSTTRP